MRWALPMAVLLAGCFDGGGAGDDRGDPRRYRAEGDNPLFGVDATGLDFGRVYVGDLQRRTIEIGNVGSGLLEIVRVRFDHVQDFRALLNGVDVVENPDALSDPDGDGRPGLSADARVALTIEFEAADNGRQVGALVIDTTAVRDPRRTLTLIARPAHPPCLRAAPAEVDFGDVPVGRAIEAEVTIDRCSRAELVLEAMAKEGEPGAFELVPLPTPVRLSEPQSFTVRYAPTERARHTDAVVLTTDAELEPELRVPLRGRGVANLCPEAAVVRLDRAQFQNTAIRLDATPSRDPDGVDQRPLRWHWRAVARPPDSTASLVEAFADPRQPLAGGPPDDPSTPEALVYLDVHGRWVFELTVEDETGLPPEGAVLPCPGARAEVVVEAARNPRPELRIRMDYQTVGLPDLRRPRGTRVDLHLRQPGEAWGGRLDCRAGACEEDWYQQGPEDDPRLRWFENGPGFQEVEVFAPARLPHIYQLGAHYIRGRDAADGFDFGPSWVTFRVWIRGELAWDSSEAVGLRRLAAEGSFWEAAEIAWPSGEVRVLDALHPAMP